MGAMTTHNKSFAAEPLCSGPGHRARRDCGLAGAQHHRWPAAELNY